MNRQRSKTMGSLMVMGGSGGRKPNGGGDGPMGHYAPIASGRVDIGLSKAQMASSQPVQLWRSQARKKAAMMADVHQQLQPVAQRSMTAARQRQSEAASMQQSLAGKSALLGKLREKTALKKLDLDRRHGEMLERMGREASHSNYDERDTYLYREHSLPYLETMMVHRRAGNEMGAAYRANDLSKPYSLAVQHGHAHGNNRNAPNTVDFQELRRTNDADEMQGMVVTHNHPSSQPLSDPDVLTSMRYDLAQVRAVGNKGVFSLKRPQNGWNYVAPFGNGTSSQARLGSHMDAATQQDLQSSQRKEVERKLRHQVEPKSDDPKIDNLLRLRQHHQVRRFAADIGATYTAPQRYVDEMTAQLGVDYPLKQANQRSKINK